MVKKIERGKVIGSIGHFTIRQVPKHEGYGKARKVISTDIAVYKAKRLIQGGFKTTKEALAHAQILMK